MTNLIDKLSLSLNIKFDQEGFNTYCDGLINFYLDKGYTVDDMEGLIVNYFSTLKNLEQFIDIKIVKTGEG